MKNSILGSGEIVKNGTKVRAMNVNGCSSSLTVGSTYTVEDCNETHVVVLDDIGVRQAYYKHRFVRVELGPLKIKDLL